MPMFKPILENEATGKVKEIFGKIIPFFLKYSEVLLTIFSFISYKSTLFLALMLIILLCIHVMDF